MTKRYTAADFANAKFAEHPTGRVAARNGDDPHYVWVIGENGRVSDHCMALADWTPVPTKPTITESRFMELVEVCSFADGPASYREFCRLAGIEIAPDPEPTNTDRLEKLIISAPGNFEGVEAILKRPANVRAWAEYLNDHGVTVPNVKDN